ncbi:MAG: hypothetical protein Q9221_005815 [Calogaya cf. arnoldii]
MSFKRPGTSSTTSPHRPLLTVPRRSAAQDLQDIFEELELNDVPPSAAGEPQPPSPLVTFAPNSPPVSPVDLLCPAGLFHSALKFTLRAISAVPDPASTPNIDDLRVNSQRRRSRYSDLEAGHPALDDDHRDLEACMPPGWPYRGWRDYAWLAWE